DLEGPDKADHERDVVHEGYDRRGPVSQSEPEPELDLNHAEGQDDEHHCLVRQVRAEPAADLGPLQMDYGGGPERLAKLVDYLGTHLLFEVVDCAVVADTNRKVLFLGRTDGLNLGAAVSDVGKRRPDLSDIDDDLSRVDSNSLAETRLKVNS